MSKALKEYGMRLYTAAKKPNISLDNINKCKNWCKDFSKWSDEEWGKVIWSDKSSVELGLSSRKIKVWRTAGQRYNPEYLASNLQSGRVSVIFWSCFWMEELGLLVSLPKSSVNSMQYCMVLKEHLFPFYSAVKGVLDNEP